MTAELDLIRRAANQMREGDDARWHRVADWLAAEAEAIVFIQAADPSYQLRDNDEALAVARAFLKEDA